MRMFGLKIFRINAIFPLCLFLISCKDAKITDRNPHFASMLGVWKIEDRPEVKIMIRSRTDTAIVVAWNYSEECPLVEAGNTNVYSSRNDQCPNESSYILRYFGDGSGQLDLPFNTTKSITQVNEDTTIESFLEWYVKYREYSVWGSNTASPIGSIVGAFENGESNWTLIGSAADTKNFPIEKEFKFIAITFSGGMKWEIDKINLGDFTPGNFSSSNLGNCVPGSALKFKDDGSVCTIKNSGYLAFENENTGSNSIEVVLRQDQ